MKRFSSVFIRLLIGLVILILAIVIANYFVESKAKNLLENQKITFEKLDIDLIRNQAFLKNLNWNKNGIQLELKEVKFEGLGYWKLLVSDKLNIDKLTFISPKIILEKATSKNKSSVKSKSNFKQHILVKEIQVKDGQFSKLDSLQQKQVTVPNFNINIGDLKIDQSLIESNIPFSYKTISFNAENIHLEVDPRQDLSISNIEVTENSALISKLHLLSKYSKEEFQKHIDKEKDRYELKVDSIKLSNYTYNFINDTLHFQNSKLSIKEPDFIIYRDKNLPDDLSYKPMYSQMLRQMPFHITMDTVSLQNASIVYQEKVKRDRKPTEVSFKDLNATILNLSNYSGKNELPQTEISVQTKFMGAAPLHVNWGFNVANKSDWFIMNGSLSNLNGSEMKTFLKPSMNMTAEGTITSMNFNFKGNKNTGGGDVDLNFKNFKVEMLKKDGTEKSGFFSSIANLFMKNDSKNSETSITDIEVERDKTKSFWNYLWSFIKKGAVKSFT